MCGVQERVDMAAHLHGDTLGGHAAHATLAQRGQRGLVARAVRQQGCPEPLQRRPRGCRKGTRSKHKVTCSVYPLQQREAAADVPRRAL